MVKTSLLESALSALVNVGSAYLNGGISPKRIGNHHSSITPYGTYYAKDNKLISIACGSQKQFEGLMKILGLEITKEFATNNDRVINRTKFDEVVNGALKNWDVTELLKRLGAENIPCQPLNDIPTVMESPQIKALDIVKNVKDVKNHKPLRLVGSPLTFEGTEKVKMEEPPILNEHAMYILKDVLKYDDTKIQGLIKKKAILDPKIGASAKL